MTDFETGIVLDLEEVDCALCGEASTSATKVFEGQDVEFRTCDNRFRFLECPRCGHWYLSPRPRARDLDAIYANYLTSNPDSAYHASGLATWLKRNVFDRRRMRPVLENLRDGSAVLEIGAGSGHQLQFFRGLVGFPLELYANDLAFDPTAREALREHDVRLLEGPIEEVETEARFDAILGIHVIEHVADPRAVFEWIARHLAPGGLLYFETPDIAAPARHLFRDHWGMTHFPRHFHLFSRRALAALATDAGLEIERHGATTSAPAWNMSIRNSLGMDALTKHRSVFEVFNYSNIFTLSAFTALDLALMLVGLPTSTQKLVARRRR